MDNDLELLITDAIQAQEKVQIRLREERQSGTLAQKVYPEVCDILDRLRDIKSEIEETAVTFEPVEVKETVLADIRNLILMNVPGTYTAETKDKLKELTTKAFNGTCREVVFGAVVTCPWYWATQEERGQQARHNSLFVVYVNKDQQFFSPVNPHRKEHDSEVIDQGWFYAAEAFHFANYILKGKARFVETLYLPESAVFWADDGWTNLKESLVNHCLGLRGFLEQCRGQAVGSLAKKSKHSGHMRLNDGATLHDFADSFRLLHHASLALADKDIHMCSLAESTFPHSIAAEALSLLKESYRVDMWDKVKLFELLMRWRKEVDKQMTGRKFIPQGLVEEMLGSWLYDCRTRGTIVPKPLCVNPGEKDKLLALMQKIGGPVVKMAPENIIMIVQAGSVLYGLNTPQSDVDYLIVYADPIQKVLRSCSRPVESVESRGPEKSFEYGAYEVRLFCEMLWKGSVVILELLFADHVEYSSDMWKILVANKNLFLTERAILQYFGLIKNNMSDIEHKRYIDTPRERKLFYQIFHKLYCLEFFLKGQCPIIKCEGETRDFILRVRKGPMERDISRENLYELCRTKVATIRRALSERTRRLPENARFSMLTSWLMGARGWEVSDLPSVTGVPSS